MYLKTIALAPVLALSACAGQVGQVANGAPVSVKIIAFNDFHGHLEPPREAITALTSNGGTVAVPAGGAAYMGSAIAKLRAANPNSVVVSAGDLIGASPLLSSLFLDEPTISAMNLIGVDFNAVGNHEFDRGRAELLRMKNGGCEKHTARQPCQVDRDFAGARFDFLAANSLIENGETLFPAYRIRSFGTGRNRVQIGFIGMTLKETAGLVTPAGVEGISFTDEVETANRLVPKLKADGADAIVLLIHQGLSIKEGSNEESCPGLSGDLLPILARLDPAVDVVVSGHTHKAYVCDYGRINGERPFLVTSAGRHGTLLTDIDLLVDPGLGKVVAKRANNRIVQSEAFVGPAGRIEPTDIHPRYHPDPALASLIRRYSAASAPLAARVVGRLAKPATRSTTRVGEHALGALIADAQLAATWAPAAGSAQIALMNPRGIRADLIPSADGSITYGQIHAVQPFGNSLVVKSMTGGQLQALLEQQFTNRRSPNILQVSKNFSYGYDLSRPPGRRIVDARIAGVPLKDDDLIRVTMNSFLASGGEGFTVFREGTDLEVGPQDLDALEDYLTRAGYFPPTVPARVRDLTPR